MDAKFIFLKLALIKYFHGLMIFQKLKNWIVSWEKKMQEKYY